MLFFIIIKKYLETNNREPIFILRDYIGHIFIIPSPFSASAHRSLCQSILLKGGNPCFTRAVLGFCRLLSLTGGNLSGLSYSLCNVKVASGLLAHTHVTKVKSVILCP